jgi:hypothetical protein
MRKMTLADLSAFLFPMRTHLIHQLQEQRADFKEQLAGKDLEIKRLRAELQTRGVRMEAPVVTAVPLKFNWPETPESKSWDTQLNEMLQEEEDGIRSGGRVQEHQSSANDGAQAKHGT